MFARSVTEPDPDEPIFYVGQDQAGHWLVQDSSKRLEGQFVSFAAAMHYARAERDIYHARIQIASTPLVPVIRFASTAIDGQALTA